MITDLWRSDNWHFYRQISDECGAISAWWDRSKNDDLWILTRCSLCSKTVEQRRICSESTVAIQDTNKIGWTKYKEAVYPPPMFGHEIQVKRGEIKMILKNYTKINELYF